jgi:hypothetical protein
MGRVGPVALYGFFQHRLALLYFTPMHGAPRYKSAHHFVQCITVFCELVLYNGRIVVVHVSCNKAVHLELLELVRQYFRRYTQYALKFVETHPFVFAQRADDTELPFAPDNIQGIVQRGETGLAFFTVVFESALVFKTRSILSCF